MSKRANGEGSIYERSDGRWAGAITYTDKTGATKRHTAYGRTQREVRAKLKDARQRLDAGAPVRDAKTTLADYVDHWTKTTLAASDRKESTKVLYAGLAKTHLKPAPLGTTPLDRLRASDVEAFVHAKRQEGKASSTVRQVYTVLRAVLDTAVRDELMARNPAAAVKRPAVERKEARYLTPDEVRALVGGIKDDRLRALYLLLLGTGLRRGEALALGWDDVDLDAGHLRVRGTLSRVGKALTVTEPKTDKSRRAVPLPAAVVTELRAHRVRQVGERLRAGSEWTEQGLVFCTHFGGLLDPRNALRSLYAVAERAGLPAVGLHTLRHSAASALIAAGVHMKVVQELLGHSSYAITADVYAHVAVSQQRDAADKLAEAFGW